MRARAATAHALRPAAWELGDSSTFEAETTPRIIDYVLLRSTGLILSVLVLGHFAVTHVVTDVARDDSTFVARRLSSMLWVAWDATMLAAALAHGALGIRIGVADYTTGHRRRSIQRAVAAFATAFFILGAIAIARVAYA